MRQSLAAPAAVRKIAVKAPVRPAPALKKPAAARPALASASASSQARKPATVGSDKDWEEF